MSAENDIDGSSLDSDDSLYDSDSEVNSEAQSKVKFPTSGEQTIVNPKPTSFKYGVVPIFEDVSPEERTLIENEMQNTIVDHKGKVGGYFSSYNITKIQRVVNGYAWRRYKRLKNILVSQGKDPNECLYWHGTPQVDNIVKGGFDERYSRSEKLMYGKGIYFAKHSSKANQYVFGLRTSCPLHHDKRCKICERRLLFCRVIMGKVQALDHNIRYDHAPEGFDSVEALPKENASWRRGTVRYSEYTVYDDAQVYPQYVVTYKIV